MLSGRSEGSSSRWKGAAAASGSPGLSSFDDVQLSSESSGVFMFFTGRKL